MEKFVIANGVATRYCDLGIGCNPVVMIHGYLESIEVWDGFIGELGRAQRVLALDIPGHGVSGVRTDGEPHTMEFCADVVAEVMDKASIERAVVIGHSMGGYIAEALCERHPERVAGLVLLHSTPYADSPEKGANRKREIEVIRSGRKEMLATSSPGKAFAAVNRKKFSEVIDDMADQVMFTDDEGIIALLEGMAVRRDMSSVVAGLKVPLLLCFGKGDEFIPVEMAEQIIKEQPEAQVAWFENSGHMSFIEERDRCVEVTNRFIDGCFAESEETSSEEVV